MDSPLNLNKNKAISCHGGAGLSSKIILKKILNKYGCIPHFKGNNYQKCITYGEVGFPNSIVKMGYDIIDLPRNLILTVPACDLMNGIKYKKWPTLNEKFIFYFKTYLYKLFSINSISLKLYLKTIKLLKQIFFNKNNV